MAKIIFLLGMLVLSVLLLGCIQNQISPSGSAANQTSMPAVSNGSPTQTTNEHSEGTRMAPFDEITAEVTILNINRAEDYPSGQDSANITIKKIINYTRNEYSAWNKLEIGDFQNAILAKYPRPTMVRCNTSNATQQSNNPTSPTNIESTSGGNAQVEKDENGNYIEYWSDCPTQPPPPWTQQPWLFWPGLEEKESVRATLRYDGEHLNIVDYKTACSEEGSTIFAKAGEYCCEGLTRIAGTEFINGECMLAPPDVFYCSNCGDGTCGLAEDPCNCPTDCQ